MLEQLTVQFEPDRSDVPALFGPKQITGPADLQIAHGDFESAAETGVLLDGTNAFACVGQQRRMARQQHIGVCLMFVTTHAPAQLIQITEAEPVGAVDDNGVGVRDIDAALDDGGGEQHIGFAVDEGGHHILQFIGLHLAVPHQNARLRHNALQFFLQRINGAHAVVQEKNLTAPMQFALDGATDQIFIVISHNGFHR